MTTQFENNNGNTNLCSVCNSPFSEDEWEDRHSTHDKNCPSALDPDCGDCDCQPEDVHANCCPDCKEKTASTENRNSCPKCGHYSFMEIPNISTTYAFEDIVNEEDKGEFTPFGTNSGFFGNPGFWCTNCQSKISIEYDPEHKRNIIEIDKHQKTIESALVHEIIPDPLLIEIEKNIFAFTNAPKEIARQELAKNNIQNLENLGYIVLILSPEKTNPFHT